MTAKEALVALELLSVQREAVLDQQYANSEKRQVLADEYSALIDEFNRLGDQANKLHELLASSLHAELKRS